MSSNFKFSRKPLVGIVLSSLSALLLSSGAALAQQNAPAKPTAQPAQAAPAGSGITREKSFPQIASGKWTGPRLADGQPNVTGYWSNTIANHNNFTDPQGGIINDPARNRRPLGPREERAPSRVSDPANGQIPFQPWAQEKVKEFQANFNNPVQPEYVEPLARCAPAGIPKSFYWHGFEFRQYPGYVLVLFDSGYRIIHLDKKPHLADQVKLWNGDSRGHWEGNTLVVEVSNLNGKALFGRSGEFFSENAKVTERYIFDNSNQRFNYVATITDPTVFTRPWTVTVPATRWQGTSQGDSHWHYKAKPATYPADYKGKQTAYDHYERICVENNGGFGYQQGNYAPAK